jgi:hyperosmotically inducible periplasmic protein
MPRFRFRQGEDMRKIVSTTACFMVSMTSMTIAIAQDTPKADNTAQNKGATRRSAVTAQKQGNSKSDIAVLAELRKTVVADRDLSMDAKNVKILYHRGLATLRGPVDSEEEKTKVYELIKASNGVTSVKNLLTVAHKGQ